MTSGSERRQFWIAEPGSSAGHPVWTTDPGGNWQMHFETLPIHVTELKPGERVISKDEIEALFEKYGIVLKKAMIRELFGTDARET